MEYGGWVILAVIGMTLVYVFVPYWIGVYRAISGLRTVECPKAKVDAVIRVDALRSSLRAPFQQEVHPKVVACSEWPRRAECAQSCTAQLRT